MLDPGVDIFEVELGEVYSEVLHLVHLLNKELCLALPTFVFRMPPLPHNKRLDQVIESLLLY